MPVDDLVNLPSGESVFIDTNIFDYHFKNKSLSCSALMTRIALGEIKAYVNTIILGDFLHKSMLAEASQKGFITSASSTKMKTCLANNPGVAPQLTACQQQVEDILTFGVKVVNIFRKTIVDSQQERHAYALMTNDSIHLHSMLNHRVPLVNLVTNDGDFGNIPNINVWQPQDVVP